MSGRAKRVDASHADRRRYDLIIDQYLKDCYRARTVARVSELAQLLQASRPYLSRIIPRLFAKPLRSVLRERQLQEAMRLLRVTTLRVDDVGIASAFGDPTTFFRSFRKHVGMTPTEYRSTALRQK